MRIEAYLGPAGNSLQKAVCRHHSKPFSIIHTLIPDERIALPIREPLWALFPTSPHGLVRCNMASKGESRWWRQSLLDQPYVGF